MSIDDPDDSAQVYLTEADVAILTGIVGHPYRMPTLPELCWAAGEHGRDLVKRRLNRLVEQGLVEEVTFEDGAPSPKLPDRFFATTDFGSHVLDRRLTPERQRALQESYAKLEKPDRILRYERAPRPPR
ncbi:hypothetical protein L593_14680 [Salinarchaeum sp. Harcht-Bsk1]|uniref:hypothetical protein n=1 Tax=Salinarchaeum sp. Harcht-Bsk1 TaxID=1333523 RepID=UPI0003422DC0|nr:hypothetical protein [Salinarchaeum sp. Harcht-Bsk1]AGN02872.1 hypothetical protein L593_14680 [Salinarchaeum sp. Harcht-Bsk1]